MIKVEILDRVFQYDNSEKGAHDIIRSVSDMTGQSGLILDCMDIDGNKIYMGYDEYIRENIDSIKDIHVHLVTEDEFVKDIIQTAYSYIQGALPKVQPIIDSLYTGNKDAGQIDNLRDLIEGISWILSVSRGIGEKPALGMDYKENMKKLEEAFTGLKDAIMNMDYILIADILNYEVSNAFTNMLSDLQKSGIAGEATGDMQ
ncbi:MAG: hypothetical protein VB106_17020 [Clostridiaceae bacterium]|nr:hypothetical protein [Clostridiaceae bacterium]